MSGWAPRAPVLEHMSLATGMGQAEYHGDLAPKLGWLRCMHMLARADI